MAEFLLEIGCEELPAAWLVQLSKQLRDGFVDCALEQRLCFGQPLAPGVPSPASERDALFEATQAWFTPRRLVLKSEVPARQQPRTAEIWGPSLKAAKDQSGVWTRAALGFAAKVGVPPDELKTGVKAGTEEHLLFRRELPAELAEAVLPGVIAGTLRYLAFPKRMSWDAWLEDGKGSFPFGRPVRWLVALINSKVVPFTIYELVRGTRGQAIVETGNVTYGHRFLPKGAAGRPQTVGSFADLCEALSRNFVLLDAADREAKIARELATFAVDALGSDDHDLRVEWRDLVEYPTVIRGRVPEQFHHLPEQVITTVLVHHQKYLPLGVREAQVVGFAAVTNTDGSTEDEIRRGMERVVVARLRDASFFYEEDLKRPLAKRVGDLTGITFHQGLGTYRDKAKRLVQLVQVMGELGLMDDAQRRAASEAAELAKVDLTTLMVREFPELQGTMGGLYLRKQGAAEDVAEAVRWHYEPIAIGQEDRPALEFAESGVAARIFAAVSLADKLDTLVGYFGIGEDPTGSRDPFGLRRAAQGALRVVLDFWRPTSNEERTNIIRLIDEAFGGYRECGIELRGPHDKVTGALQLFLLDRLAYLLEYRGFAAVEVAAVLYTDPTVGPYALEDPYDCLLRLRALHKVRAEHQDDFAQLATAFKRANNILTKSPGIGFFDERHLVENAEIALYRAIEESRRGWRDDKGHLSETEYETRLRSVGQLAGSVDRFFSEVLVLAEQEHLRRNRLGLMEYLIKPVSRIADISRLGG
ncbi:MAG TPA: glycine--tRNA ligase subunit beta [Vicinamibacteria bacterium]|nr:glycine--tRNA ligase subunit beta [Vicinamibacteria bacterium]